VGRKPESYAAPTRPTPRWPNLAREMIISAELPGSVRVKMPGIAPKLSETPGAVRWSGPELGGHTDAVLADLGKTETEILDLRRGGIVQ
jgi:crotonobetainyl-CoA:carnitine CoA-transferase CaiB-like acyl-CoA transferase